MIIDIDGFKGFFFKAALNSWAGVGKKTTILELPKSKVLIWEEGNLRYVDLYFKAYKGTESFGQTIIWSKGIPVWWMQYYGDYPERAIKFLKAALCKAYQHKQFFGGRGPGEFRKGNLIYLNHLEEPSTFTDFKGREEIRDLTGRYAIGYHNYIGGLLTPSTITPSMIKV